MYLSVLLFFFFKQKTAYEMRISDWSSDVCSSDLIVGIEQHVADAPTKDHAHHDVKQQVGHAVARPVDVRQTRAANRHAPGDPETEQIQIGRASCRERGCQYM